MMQRGIMVFKLSEISTVGTLVILLGESSFLAFWMSERPKSEAGASKWPLTLHLLEVAELRQPQESVKPRSVTDSWGCLSSTASSVGGHVLGPASFLGRSDIQNAKNDAIA